MNLYGEMKLKVDPQDIICENGAMYITGDIIKQAYKYFEKYCIAEYIYNNNGTNWTDDKVTYVATKTFEYTEDYLTQMIEENEINAIADAEKEYDSYIRTKKYIEEMEDKQ